MELLDRIEEGIAKIPISGCWIWTKAVNAYGYGVIRHQRKTISVHRALYELTTGTKIGDQKACHRCDVPSCCNPDHIFLGSQADNLKDMASKNRGRPRLSKCKYGHSLSGENLYVAPDERHICRTCAEDRRAKHRERNKL